MFSYKTINKLPKCEVAHSIRQSYLHKKTEDIDVHSEVSNKYPLPYYYLKKGYHTSFYYKKNDLISYYTHSMDNNNYQIIPLYNHTKDDYEIVLSDFPYNFLYHHEVCLVKAPSGRIYICTRNLIGNVSRGTLLHALSDDTPFKRYSMPIANSFILAIENNAKAISICVIDLIKERKYIRKYQISKVIEDILKLSKESNTNYEELQSIKTLEKLSFGYTIIHGINNKTGNVIFYDKYKVMISLYFSSDETGDFKFLVDALSVVATYQDKTLKVSLQINDKINLKTSTDNYEINFGTSKIFMSGSYKIDDKYDISQSHLYSVMASIGDYTIISEPNISKNIVTLYHKNEPSSFLTISEINMINFNDMLIIRLLSKTLIAIDKHKLVQSGKANRYYVRKIESDNIAIINAEMIRDLTINIKQKTDNAKWVDVDIANVNKAIIHVNLKDKLKEVIRPYTCSSGKSDFFLYAYYTDYDKEEMYILTYFKCLGKDEQGWLETKKHQIYLFKCKISHLNSGYQFFRLVKRLEFDTNKYLDNVTRMLRYNAITGDYSRILRLLGNKWNTGNALADLKIFEIYDEYEAYYDFKYNRRSIKAHPVDESIKSILHLVRKIMPTF